MKDDAKEAPTPRAGHSARVDAWLARCAGLPLEERLRLFDQALAAVWSRAHRPLGAITLRVVLDRVLLAAKARWDILAPLRADQDGVRLEVVREEAMRRDAAEIVDAFRFILVELLAVLGMLTGEVITPSLHAALSSVGPGEGKETQR